MSIILTSHELDSVTGYRTSNRQLAELHRQGFYRARIGATGNVILERAHYDAVCAGDKPAKEPTYVRNGVCMRAARYKGLSQQKGDQIHRYPLNQETYQARKRMACPPTQEFHNHIQRR